MNRLLPRSAGIGVAGLLVLAACSVDTTQSPRPGGGGASPEGSPAVGDGSQSPELSSELSVSTSGWATDFSRHEVPLNEFISGGPGKDGGIPAIDDPKFQPISEVDWLEDQEPVIALGFGEEWRAYPIPRSISTLPTIAPNAAKAGMTISTSSTASHPTV
jgi:hypothetical protein